MKKILLFIFVIAAFTAKSQTYAFSKKTETYQEFSGGTAISGTDWYDNIYSVSLPFTFNYFGQNFSTLYIYGGFASFSYEEIQVGDETAYDLSGYEFSVFDTPMYGDADASPITYTSTGSAGSRVFKVQWKNALLVNDETMEDRASFQLWLYEATGTVEFHYGPTSIENENSYDIPGTGTVVSILNGTGSDGYVLTGDPANPVAHYPPSSAQSIFLTGAPANGMVYVFTKSASTGTLAAEHDTRLKVYPNPFNQFIGIHNDSPVSVTQINVYSTDGSLVLSASADLNEIPTTNLKPGMYVLEIITDQGISRRTLIK